MGSNIKHRLSQLIFILIINSLWFNIWKLKRIDYGSQLNRIIFNVNILLYIFLDDYALKLFNNL